MRRRINHNKDLQNYIINNIKESIVNDKDINALLDNNVINEMLLNIELDKQHEVVANAILEGIGFKNMNTKPTKLNESLLVENKNVNLYNYVNEAVKLSKKHKKPTDVFIGEGILSGLVGSVLGATVGTSIGKAVCNALGIKEKSVLWDLMTSKLVNASICAKLGLRM